MSDHTAEQLVVSASVVRLVENVEELVDVVVSNDQLIATDEPGGILFGRFNVALHISRRQRLDMRLCQQRLEPPRSHPPLLARPPQDVGRVSTKTQRSMLDQLLDESGHRGNGDFNVGEESWDCIAPEARNLFTQFLSHALGELKPSCP